MTCAGLVDHFSYFEGMEGRTLPAVGATLVVTRVCAPRPAGKRATTRVAPTRYMPTPAALKMSREAGRVR
jgi:hypothetical protein